MTDDHESLKWRAVAEVEKWSPEQVSQAEKELGHIPSAEELKAAFTPEVVREEGNLITTAGLTRIMSLINGAGGQALTNTATRLGVGNSSTAAAVGQTDLQASAGSTNRYFMPMDATYPSVSGAVLTAKSTFASADGNFVWNEWCLDVGTPTVAAGTTVAALMVNRKVASLGTKASGAVWALTVTLTLA